MSLCIRRYSDESRDFALTQADGEGSCRYGLEHAQPLTSGRTVSASSDEENLLDLVPDCEAFCVEEERTHTHVDLELDWVWPSDREECFPFSVRLQREFRF